jgi:tRNA uridine 5-carboxymethylaminomethyl modification enzyme
VNLSFDIIVVGAGHAGCEAAAAAANLGSKVLLISSDITKFAQMSCNPAMGGIAKGQIVREIDALGGLAGIITDNSTIQFRMLNRSKGPAMWSPRAQCDRFKFTEEWRRHIENIPNVSLWQDTVSSLIETNGKVCGVKTTLGIAIKSNAVILTNGTFLGGKIHVGSTSLAGGRIGEPAVFGLTENLLSLGFESGRMKTGTPVRIDGRTVDYSKLIEQKPDEQRNYFSYLTTKHNSLSQRSCFIAHTTLKTHNLLKRGFEESPLFSGTIKGVGPRYCPSIEDKLRTFADKDSHQLFLEPEGESTYEMYLNGFSSSLPAKIQYEALRTIEGFENVHIIRPGYAIEYDFFQPTQLKHTLETKKVENLYFAGQINGTTGYEEAGAQGLMAGINAHLKLNQKEALVLNRDQAYIGVLIDDLVIKGVDEPYRMFTSRAEHRVLLRQDNADERLTELSYNIGLASEDRYKRMIEKQKLISKAITHIKKTTIKPEVINPFLIEKNLVPINQARKLVDILLRPEVSILELKTFGEFSSLEISEALEAEVFEATEIQIKYQGYIERERLVADRFSRLDHIQIHADFDYSKLNSLSTEARQKLMRIKPTTIGQAKGIPGVSPNDINILLVYFGR